MPLKIYNTLSRKKENFSPINPPNVGVYTCGPTVYWYQHIGNLKAYIFADILKRVLTYNGYKVKHVINVTDVGHLTSDEDTGEDKIEKAASREGKTAEEISKYYFNLFQKDFEKLNIIPPFVWSWATKHISEQISLIKSLEKKGYTYKTADGIYFDTSKINPKDYARLAKLDIKGLQAGKRIDLSEKKNKTDFALWKFSEKPEMRQQEWDSPWGVGFPGWHIECSAMSIKYLGEQFDIHTGGEEHIPVHHTNEIAQSECATGKKPWVKYWMHQRWLVDETGNKMSKSKGGILTLSELCEKGYFPMVFRYFVLGTHYRKPLYFSYEKIEGAKNSYERLKNIVSEIKDDKKTNKKYMEEFENAINDDLNTPEALQVLWKIVRDEKATGKLRTIKKMDEVFGLKILEKIKIEIPKEVKKLAQERENFRKEKNWKKSDELREKIKKFGFEILDGKEGWEIKK
ncbi:MAG: cysteine--tRNA ligase [Nanoarchaeota archaeon]|nr:cysteine--tRNA ligase [Nanoarchaeota archaeon]